MSSSAEIDGLALPQAVDARGDGARNVLGFAGSLVLHAAVLLALLAVGQGGSQATAGGARFIPVEVLTEAHDATQPVATGAAVASEQWQKGTLADAGAAGAAPAALPDAGKAPQDALETKLEALARLRQADAEIQSGPNREMAATGDAQSFGSGVPFGLRDFLRAQVERRWHLDVANLAAANESVPIHVEIARDGSVLKAEAERGTQSDDPAYRELVASARNAVLAASPFALPPGRYQDVMEVVLDLNPRDALR